MVRTYEVYRLVCVPLECCTKGGQCTSKTVACENNLIAGIKSGGTLDYGQHNCGDIAPRVKKTLMRHAVRAEFGDGHLREIDVGVVISFVFTAAERENNGFVSPI